MGNKRILFAAMLFAVVGMLNMDIKAASYDFDGDGKSDIAIYRPSNGQWWIMKSSDGSHYALTFGLETDKIVPADYTGDGKTDVAVFRPSTGEWFILRSEDNSYYAFQFGTEEDIPVPGDYDNDGFADVAVFRSTTGIWYILRSTEGMEFALWGLPGDTPLTGDATGDGKSDLVIVRGPVWWIRNSSDHSAFAVYFGSINPETQQDMLGDFTGDGLADMSYFNYPPMSSNSIWGVRRSENGSVYAYGADSGAPVPGDYDGDGMTDRAYFNASTGIWRLYNSTNNGNYEERHFGMSGDIPVPGAYVR